MDLYLKQVTPEQRFDVAISYLCEDADNCYLVVKYTGEIGTWEELGEAMQSRYNPMTSKKASRDILDTILQKRTVSEYHAAFQRILIEIISTRRR